MQLSPHFTLEELTRSETASLRNISNNPDTPAHLDNLKRLAGVLERVRDLLGQPILVTSGYRSAALNRAVGGVPTSAHLSGLAADFVAPAFGSPKDVCRAIEPFMAAYGIDQLICERFGASYWTHLGLSDGPPRHQAFTMTAAGTVKGFP